MIDPPDAYRQLASLPLAVVLLAPRQVVTSVNPTAEQFFGQSARRIIHRPLSEFVRFREPRLVSRMQEPDAHVSARATEIELLGQGARRLDVTISPVIDHAGWQVLTLAPIGGAEAMGEERHLGDDSFLRAPEILAHEIKNPLAGIRGAAQLLGRKLSGQELALTGLIADEVDRVAKLIDQMQSLSRKTPRPLSPCNLHEAVRRAGAIILAGGNSPTIEEAFDPSLPLVLGNADSLVQIVINLLDNAVDACRDTAEPRIVVRTRFSSGLHLHTGADGLAVRLPIELRVSDNGHGIEPALREHLFEPFVTTKKTGQGLGLALVRRLVRDMNGRIGHDRDDASGWTHFRLHLPMAVGEQTPGKEGDT